MANSDREVLVSIPLSKEAIKSFSEFGASWNKKKQLLHWFLEKTGFGKSLIFQRLVPKKEIMTRKPSTVVIVCPLQGIVYDQMGEASSMGLTAATLTDCCLEEIECGKYNLVFASAEEVLANPFLSLMKKAATPLHSNMCAIIVCNQTQSNQRGQKIHTSFKKILFEKQASSSGFTHLQYASRFQVFVKLK